MLAAMSLFREIPRSVQQGGAGDVAEQARQRHEFAVSESALHLAGIHQHLRAEARQERLDHGGFHLEWLAVLQSACAALLQAQAGQVAVCRNFRQQGLDCLQDGNRLAELHTLSWHRRRHAPPPPGRCRRSARLRPRRRSRGASAAIVCALVDRAQHGRLRHDHVLEGDVGHRAALQAHGLQLFVPR